MVALLLLSAAQASALSLPFTVEFDDGTLGDYGTIDVSEDGAGGLDFAITVNPADPLLGLDADLHELYFNLDGIFTGLAIGNDNAPNSAYTLMGADPAVAGGAGSSFDWGVNFGNGAGPAGNGILQFATFTLTANEALSEADLLETSSTSQNITAFFAMHLQGTDSAPGSETVGAIPEPATALLMGVGLVGLAIVGRRRR